jgi:hypothetical protein
MPPLSWDDVCAMTQHALPEVERSTYYRYPALKVRGRFIAGSKDPDVLVLSVDLGSRDVLLRADPDTFFITDHYRDSKAVLVRLSSVERAHLLDLLEDAWRAAAPESLVDELDRRRADDP